MSDTVTIGTATLAAGVVATAYTQTLSASAGTAPYAWTAPLGPLPQGLTLSAAGVITGTPTRAETRNFVVRATDSLGETGDRVLQIVVTDPAGVTPSGMISLPLFYLQKTVAASANFQRVTGAADAAEALDYCYIIGEPTGIAPPLAVVGLEKGFTRTGGPGGARTYFSGSAGLELLLRLAVAAGASDDEAFFAFSNDAASILADMESLAGTAGYLDATSFTLKEGPARPKASERATVGDFVEAIWTVRAALGV